MMGAGLVLLVAMADPAAWWESYGDPVLNRLVERALKTNLDLKVAAQRVAEARALSAVAQSALGPEVSFGAGAQQLRGGFQQGVIRIPESGAGRSFVAPFETGLLAGSVDSRWELSFWGPNGKRFAASRSEVAAQMEQERDLRLAVSAEVALNYLGLRSVNGQLALAGRRRAVQQEVVELTRMRAQAGLAAELEAVQEAAEAARLAAALPVLERERAVRLNRLAVLVGDRELPQEDFPASLAELEVPTLAAAIDSELLRRRPDVRAAEARIEAALARYQEARADLYPRLFLTGLFGRQSTNLGGLSLGSGNFFNLGPQLQLPIFNRGRIRANIEANNRRLEQEKIAYERELLEAFQEAEDAIAAYRLELERKEKLEAAAGQARTARRLAEGLAEAGLGDWIGVLEAEKSLVELEMAIESARGAAALGSVRLYKALGGGWPARVQSPPYGN